MGYRALWASCFLLSACTVANPLFTGGLSLDAGHDGAQVENHDLSTAPTPDLAAQCQPGERACNPGTTQLSAGCTDGKFTPDRLCPSQSDCMGGYCAPPPQNGNGLGEPCDFTGTARENECTQFSQALSCQPFIDSQTMQVSWICDQQVGQGLPGQTCDKGSQCRSGFCGDNGTCFRGCFGDGDCPINNGLILQCASVTITVEGQQVMATSCIPM